MPAAVMWFRRDLRLADNPALLAAVDAGGGAVLPLFVLDDRLLRPAGPNRVAYLFRALRSLDADLGGRLVVRAGDPTVVVRQVAHEVGAPHVHVTADFGPYGRARDAALGDLLQRIGSPYAVDPGTVRKTDGSPFKVFTPFFRTWRSLRPDPPEAPPSSRVDWVAAPSDGIPADPPVVAALPAAGERAAHARLDAFREGLACYGQDRDAPGADATSRLSVDLKYGTLHPRQLLHGLGRSESAQRFRTELAWREFYADVLWHRPESAREVLQPVMANLEVDEGPDAEERWQAWTEGRTGFSIVDAGMRQLVAEGWMHNRVRMITASFLVKDLHLDWRRGARFFLHHLVDGDLASNQHGWQWVAGTGTDPAPFHRIFNPTRQSERFDPDGEYVRRYVPELGTPAYPPPIVDHDRERRDALGRYAAARAASAG